jgi:hypothetical protein
MKSFFIYLVASFSIVASAEDVQIFTGFSRRSGQPYDCASVPLPSPQEAEVSADGFATAYCSETGMMAVRISDYDYSFDDCVWGGPQYKIPSDTLSAKATYSCASDSIE